MVPVTINQYRFFYVRLSNSLTCCLDDFFEDHMKICKFHRPKDAEGCPHLVVFNAFLSLQFQDFEAGSVFNLKPYIHFSLLLVLGVHCSHVLTFWCVHPSQKYARPLGSFPLPIKKLPASDHDSLFPFINTHYASLAIYTYIYIPSHEIGYIYIYIFAYTTISHIYIYTHLDG